MGEKITRLHDFTVRLQHEIMLSSSLCAIEKEFLWQLAVFVDIAGFCIIPNKFFVDKALVNDRTVTRVLKGLEDKGFIYRSGNSWFYHNGVVSPVRYRNFRHVGNEINIVLSKFGLDDYAANSRFSSLNKPVKCERDIVRDDVEFFRLIDEAKSCNWSNNGVVLQLHSYISDFCEISARIVNKTIGNNNVTGQMLLGYAFEILKNNFDKLPGNFTQAKQYLVKATANNYLNTGEGYLNNNSVEQMLDYELVNVENMVFASSFEPDFIDIYSRYAAIMDMFYVNHNIDYYYTAKAILLCVDIANNNHITYQKSSITSIATNMYGFNAKGIYALMNLTCRRRGKSSVLTPNEIARFSQMVCDNFLNHTGGECNSSLSVAS